MTDNKKQIGESKGIEILLKHTLPISFSFIQYLFSLDPQWGMLFLTASGMVNMWDEFGQTRLNEFIEGIKERVGLITPEMLETEEFKVVFLNILERYIRESSLDRRKILLQYLISVGKGEKPNYDYHTKLLNILDQITGDELHLFLLLPLIEEDSYKEMERLDKSGNQSSYEGKSYNIAINTLQIKMRLKNINIDEKKVRALLRFLSNYGLIIIEEITHVALGGSGGTDIVYLGMTDVGKVFTDFIDNRFVLEIIPNS